MKNIITLCTLTFLNPLFILSAAEPKKSDPQNAQEIFCQLVYVDKCTREHIVSLTELADVAWSETYKKVCADILDGATVMMHNDVASAVTESLMAATQPAYEHIKKHLEQYQQLLHEGKAHLCNWELDESNQLHTRNFDGDRIILQLGVRSLTVEGTEMVNGLLLVNGIVKVNGRIILNNVDLTNLIANSSCSGSGGGGGNCITAINGNSGSVTGTTVTIAGGNNIHTSGSGTILTVSVSGTTQNEVQIGSGTNSLTSVTTGTAGQVLTSNGPSLPPTFQTPASGVTINGDTGSVSGTTLTFNATSATLGGTAFFTAASGTTMFLNFTDSAGPGAQNTCLGQGTPQVHGRSSASSCTCLGYQALNALNAHVGTQHTCIGAGSLQLLGTNDQSPINNTAIGYNTGAALQNGSNNVFLGSLAGLRLTGTGVAVSADNNTLVGYSAGSNYTGNESNNICLGANVNGKAGESNVMNLGTFSGGGTNGITSTFITGIINNNIPNTNPLVLIDSNNQLGTVNSSRRFKEHIAPMPEALSANILKLQPATFNYRADEHKTPAWGLIAEEVEEIFPHLVAHDKNGIPFSIKYHELPVLLLHLLQKLKHKLTTCVQQAATLKKELEHLKKNGCTQKEAREISEEEKAQNTQQTQKLFGQLVYVDTHTREHLVTLFERLPQFPWSATYKNICADILEQATVVLHDDVAPAIAQAITAACTLTEHERIQKHLEQYQEQLAQGNAHLCNWERDQDNQLHTRNFDGDRIILQLGVRSLTVEGTEIVNGLLLVNGILKVNGRIILNNVDITDLIASSSCSSSGGGGGSCITTIDGNSGAISGNTVTIAGGNNITTSGSGTALTVSVSGTTPNAVQIGNVSNNGSLTSVTPLGTAGQVLTSNGPGAAPSFQDPSNALTINGDVGLVTGSTLNFTAKAANSGTVRFVGDNVQTMTLIFSDASHNTCIGQGTPLGSGISSCTSLGYFALDSLSTGSQNTAVGYLALSSLITGSNNTGMGYQTGLNVSNGQNNTFVGSQAGEQTASSSATGDTFIGLNSGTYISGTSSSNNIYVGASVGSAIAAENNTMRLGNSSILETFIAGIFGKTTGTADATQVFISSSGGNINQLGITPSSKHVKENIAPLPNSLSDKILQLQPVTFNYIADKHKTLCTGLIAEDVQEILPTLVTYDKDNMPLSIKYHELPILLLNLFKKLQYDIALSAKQVAMLTQKIELIKKSTNTKKGFPCAIQ